MDFKMSNTQMIEEVSELQDVQEQNMKKFRSDVEAIKSQMDGLEELPSELYYIRETIREACVAALEGNYGVGAIVTNKRTGEIIARGHNRLSDRSNPMFHALHAEMDAMRVFQETHSKAEIDELLKNREITCYTSLESCPMCAQGLFNAGCREVVTGSLDSEGGLVLSNPDCVVPVMKKLFKESGTVHRLPNVDLESPEAKLLTNLALEIFLLTKTAMDDALAK